jgi:hypothetical protein
MMLALMPPCRSGALATIARTVLPLAIGPRAGERGCYRFIRRYISWDSVFTTTAYPLRVRNNPALWMRPVSPDTP